MLRNNKKDEVVENKQQPISYAAQVYTGIQNGFYNSTFGALQLLNPASWPELFQGFVKKVQEKPVETSAEILTGLVIAWSLSKVTSKINISLEKYAENSATEAIKANDLAQSSIKTVEALTQTLKENQRIAEMVNGLVDPVIANPSTLHFHFGIKHSKEAINIGKNNMPTEVFKRLQNVERSLKLAAKNWRDLPRRMRLAKEQAQIVKDYATGLVTSSQQALTNAKAASIAAQKAFIATHSIAETAKNNVALIQNASIVKYMPLASQLLAKNKTNGSDGEIKLTRPEDSRIGQTQPAASNMYEEKESKISATNVLFDTESEKPEVVISDNKHSSFKTRNLTNKQIHLQLIKNGFFTDGEARKQSTRDTVDLDRASYQVKYLKT